MRSLILALACLAPIVAADRLEVHEWGTLTTLATPQGMQLRWELLAVDGLPAFVHRRFAGDPLLRFDKGMPALARMETPVLYFYPSAPMRAAVEVTFPAGLVTEWYPAAARTASRRELRNASVGRYGLGGDRVRWDVDLAPGSAALPVLRPDDPHTAHYHAARVGAAATVSASGTAGTEREGHIFYRGVADLATPVSARIEGGSLLLTNEGDDAVGALVAIEVDGQRMRSAELGGLAGGGEGAIAIDAAPWVPAGQAVAALGRQLAERLTETGLSADEASAMVATWRDHWLREPGLRVLALLPQSWTDRVLPLRVAPAPDRIVRTMVARLEIATEAEVGAARHALAELVAGRAVDPVLLAAIAKRPRFWRPIVLASPADDAQRRQLAKLLDLIDPAPEKPAAHP